MLDKEKLLDYLTKQSIYATENVNYLARKHNIASEDFWKGIEYLSMSLEQRIKTGFFDIEDQHCKKSWLSRIWERVKR